MKIFCNYYVLNYCACTYSMLMIYLLNLSRLHLGILCSIINHGLVLFGASAVSSWANAHITRLILDRLPYTWVTWQSAWLRRLDMDDCLSGRGNYAGNLVCQVQGTMRSISLHLGSVLWSLTHTYSWSLFCDNMGGAMAVFIVWFTHRT